MPDQVYVFPLLVSLAAVAGPGHVFAAGDHATSTIAMILLEFTHVCTPSQHGMLQSIVDEPATATPERVIAQALLHVEHTASLDDMPQLEALMKDDSARVPVKILASVIYHLIHTPTDADRGQLKRLASANGHTRPTPVP
jgi:hypothetical protein